MIKYITVLFFLVSGFASAEIFGRFSSGSWHDLKGTWRIGSEFVEKLPGSDDVVQLISKDEIIELSDASVTVKSLGVGSWEPGLVQKVVLIVRTNLTAELINIGFSKDVPRQRWGSGELVVSGGEVITHGNTFIGGTGNGTLTVSNGGVFRNNAWRITLGSTGKIVIDDGIVSMKNGVLMEEGAIIHINGTSQLHISGSNQSRAGSPILDYIKSGWIFGNGTAGNVLITYDGQKTVISVPPGK